MRRNNFFVRLVLCTMAVILVSVILVGTASSFTIQNEIQNSTEAYYEQRFAFSCDLMERHIFQPIVRFLSEMVVMDTWDKVLRELNAADASQMRIIEARDLLAEVRRSNGWADVMVYSPRHRYVLSAEQGVHFLDHQDVSTPFDLEWLEWLPSDEGRIKWLGQRKRVSATSMSEDVFTVILRRSFSRKSTVPVYISMSVSVQKLGETLFLENDERLFMINDMGETVLGTEALPEAFSHAQGVIKDGEHIYFIADSDIAPWRFVMKVPLSSYTRRGQVFRTQTILVCAGVFLLIAGISVWVIERMITPFTEMLERARAQRVQVCKRRRDDLRFVADVFHEYVDNAHVIQQQMAERLELVKHSFLLSLLMNRQFPAGEMATYSRLFGLDAELPYFAAAILHRGDNPFTIAEEKTIDGRIAELTCDDCRLSSVGVYGNRIYVVIHCADFEKAQLLLSQLIEPLEGNCKVNLGVGDAVEALTMIHQSFEQAEKMVEGDGESEAAETEAEAENHLQTTQRMILAQRAAQFLSEKYMLDVSVGDIADHLKVSRSHLSRGFKEAYGMTVLEYLLTLRLDEALRLLEETELSVAEIAARVGFANSNYFFRKFKEKYHVTPGQYRTIKTK